MCDICQKARKLDQSQALKLIGDAMKVNPKQHEHLSVLLDEILGIVETKSNSELDEAWERGHR